jgi:hypothetical protein
MIGLLLYTDHNTPPEVVKGVESMVNALGRNFTNVNTESADFNKDDSFLKAATEKSIKTPFIVLDDSENGQTYYAADDISKAQIAFTDALEKSGITLPAVTVLGKKEEKQKPNYMLYGAIAFLSLILLIWAGIAIYKKHQLNNR